MEHLQYGMKRKWERHYKETKTTFAIIVVILGFCIMISLVLLWPQVLSSSVFNNRMAFHLIVNDQSLFTCNPDYIEYLVDEPSEDERLLSIFVFNVTNPKSVIERGEEPHIIETGPYGFKRLTYRYDVKFDKDFSKTMTFKEYDKVLPVESSSTCKHMFFKADRDHPALGVTNCIKGECNCKNDNYDEELTMLNPSFSQVLWEEKPSIFMSRLSSEVFKTIKNTLDYDFVTAVKSHLIKDAMLEIYYFRFYSQIGVILNATYHDLHNRFGYQKTKNLFLSESYSKNKTVTCLLQEYNIQECPWNSYSIIQDTKSRLIRFESRYRNIIYMNYSYPSLTVFINQTNPLSFLNLQEGLPKWIGITNYVASTYVLEYSAYLTKFTMTNATEQKLLFQSFSTQLATQFYGASYTYKDLLASEMTIISVATYLTRQWMTAFPQSLKKLVYAEWRSTSTPVICAPLGQQCTWQIGYLADTDEFISQANITDRLISSFIDPGNMLSTNPNNIYYDGNSGPYFNTYKYCNNIIFKNISVPPCETDEYNFREYDAIVGNPSGLFGIDESISQINRTDTLKAYQLLNDSTKSYYIQFSCRVSRFIYETYANLSTFHDEYVIRYINQNIDKRVNHVFTTSDWTDLGAAQWGGGFITQAAVGVRSIFEVKRNGMWYFGSHVYYENYIEYSSWALTSGYPNAMIYEVSEAKALLTMLARNDEDGLRFRKTMIETHTTFIGDGTRYIHNIGDVGEIAYIPENNLANFTCKGTVGESECEVLNKKFQSSYANCEQINNLFQNCLQRIISRNKWITNCNQFETTITSPQSLVTIECDEDGVQKNPHPYQRSRGNIIAKMLLDLTVTNVLDNGLWCDDVDDCDYEKGGVFIKTSPRKLLFEGYSDPSVIKYINMKHESHNISFQCSENPFDSCGKKNYHCSHKGLLMKIPNGKNFSLSYENTRKDRYFAKNFEVDLITGELFWRYSMLNDTWNQTIINPTNLIKVINPIWAAYPAWDSNDTTFQKFHQCQKRVYGGPPNLFESCEDTVYTGAEHISQVKNINIFHGNSTIVYSSNISHKISGFTNRQYSPSLWKGFNTYPYLFNFKTSGEGYSAATKVALFSKDHVLAYDLSQSEVAVGYNSFTLKYPLFDGVNSNKKSSSVVTVRRFGDAKDTWSSVHYLANPVDSVGMQYTVPQGMASIEELAGYPVFTSTPHHFGNQLWGGFEYRQFAGLAPKALTQMSYVDFDPVSGRGIRHTQRQQVNIRVEKNPVYRNLFSSQSRCISPTKVFSGGSGYGCFAYMPLLWFEDFRIQKESDFRRVYEHYYLRPDRAGMLSYIGAGIGFVLIVFGTVLFIIEARRRHKFETRIFVD